jgi:acetyl esterase
MPAPTIDPEIGAALAALGDILPALGPEQLEELRRQRLVGLAALPLSEGVDRKDYDVPGRPGQPEVIVRVHTPVGLEGPAPCLYSIHGGGYVMGH